MTGCSPTSRGSSGLLKNWNIDNCKSNKRGSWCLRSKSSDSTCGLKKRSSWLPVTGRDTKHGKKTRSLATSWGKSPSSKSKMDEETYTLLVETEKGKVISSPLTRNSLVECGVKPAPTSSNRMTNPKSSKQKLVNGESKDIKDRGSIPLMSRLLLLPLTYNGSRVECLPMSKSKKALVEAHERGYNVTKSGSVISSKGKLLSLMENGGYLHFNIKFEGDRFPIRVHRLQAFQKFGESMLEGDVLVRHLNGDSLDNSYVNIGIGSHSDNAKDRPKHDRVAHAQKAGKSNSLPKEVWEQIKEDYAKGLGYKKLRAKYGVGLSTLSYNLSTKAKKKSL